MNNPSITTASAIPNLFNSEFEDVSKQAIKLKISWRHDYNLFFDYVPLETLSIGENGNINVPSEIIKEKINIIEKNNDDIKINIPNGFKAILNDTIPINEIQMLKFGDKIVLTNNNITIEIERTVSGKIFKTNLFENSQKWIYTLISGMFHVLLIFAFAFFMPPLGINDYDEINKDNLFLMQQYLTASAEREMQTKQTEESAIDNADDKEGGTGTRAKGEEGSMGNPNSRDSNKRYAVAGPKENMDAHIARSNALREASTFGMIGLINSASGGDPNAPTAPWGRDDSLGNDPISARGNMWGDEIGDAFGANGLGLSGIGEGAGGKGEGIGLGSIGTLGHGAGIGTNQGFSNGHGRLSGGHKMKVPTVRYGITSVTGRLPAEVIQRIVRQNYGRFRVCYEAGLRGNPNLQGRVSVRFIIGRDGSVSNVGNGGSDLPDPNVVSCVIRAFYGLSFPEPKDGIVSVIYPIMFSAQ